MNIRRFTGANSRAVLAQVRAELGDDALILANRPAAGGIEILATRGSELEQRVAERAAQTAAPRVPARPDERSMERAALRPMERPVERAVRPQDERGMTRSADKTVRSSPAGHVPTLSPQELAGRFAAPLAEVPPAAGRATRGAGVMAPQRSLAAYLGAADSDSDDSADSADDPHVVLSHAYAREVAAAARPQATRAAVVPAQGHVRPAPFAPTQLAPTPFAPTPAAQIQVAPTPSGQTRSEPAQADQPPPGAAHPAPPNFLPQASAQASPPALLHVPAQASPLLSQAAHAALALQAVPAAQPAAAVALAAPPAHAQLLEEIRAMKELLSEQIATLAWDESLRRKPLQAALMRELANAGFSAALARTFTERLPDDYSPAEGRAWLAQVLARNLRVRAAPDIVEEGGLFALVGPTGVGKTTTTAKIAARCVMRHGARCLGLITTDHYRVGAHDQLRVYGKILGVTVMTAHDAGELRHALDACAGKHLVLIDTTGMSQRDARVLAQQDMLAGGAIQRLLLLNAAAQIETLDDVVRAYGKGGLAGMIITKLDEAVCQGGVLDVALRHKLTVHYATRGQRVPEDIEVPTAAALIAAALAGLRPLPLTAGTPAVAIDAVPLTVPTVPPAPPRPLAWQQADQPADPPASGLASRPALRPVGHPASPPALHQAAQSHDA